LIEILYESPRPMRCVLGLKNIIIINLFIRVLYI